MLSKIRNSVYNAIGITYIEPETLVVGGEDKTSRDAELLSKYPYQRPTFLQLVTENDIKATRDHHVRPILVPPDVDIFPWFAGYAEVINAGKSKLNHFW